MTGGDGIEIELKLALASKDDHGRLADALPGFLDEVVQENHYWDLPDGTLTSRGIMLRLRLESESAVITVKRDAVRRDDGLFRATEDEESIPRDLAESIVAGRTSLADAGSTMVAKLAGELGDLGALRRWGSMTNHRRRYRLEGDLVAELDHTIFLDEIHEWEVELECADPERGHAILTGHLDNAGVRYEPQQSSKSARLHAYIEARRDGS